MTNQKKDDTVQPNITEPHVRFFGRTIKQSDLVKLVGLLVFFIVVIAIAVALMPYFKEIFEPGGVERVITEIQSQGPFGVGVLFVLQLVQIIVAFIPGEVVQIAAGMLYGPVGGTIIVLIGCVISSSIIFQLVHRLGAPFVRSMVSDKYLDKFRDFERSGKLNVVVFILFLIPGLPKDVFTYLVPLTDMRMRTFLILTTVGRTPGVIVSTYAASGLASGDTTTSIIIFAVAAAIALIGILMRNKIMHLMGKTQKIDTGDPSKN